MRARLYVDVEVPEVNCITDFFDLTPEVSPDNPSTLFRQLLGNPDAWYACGAETRDAQR